MASLKHIKSKIRSIDKTRTVTKAMEAVSAVKMRKAQERALAARPHAIAALEILRRVGANIALRENKYFAGNHGGKVLFVVITSDKGLAGNLNNGVLRLLARDIEALRISKDDLSFVCLGKKGAEFIAKRGYRTILSHANIADTVSLAEVHEITTLVRECFERGECDSVKILYPNFISTFAQEAVARTMLPVNVAELESVVRSITPARGKYAHLFPENGEGVAAEYLLEPDAEAIFRELIPTLLTVYIFHALMESKASEHSARMVSMKNASDKAEELSEELTVRFNKARQTAITREVSEITGGIEAVG